MQTDQKKTNYRSYEELPEGAPYQLISGELVESPSPTVSHHHITKSVFLKLYMLEKSLKGKTFFAPIDVYLDEADIYQPDVIFISSKNEEIIKEKRIEGAPDIVVEVLSPSTAYYDLRMKKSIYEKSGVMEYWLIDPIERSAELYVNQEQGFVRVCMVWCDRECEQGNSSLGVIDQDNRTFRSRLFPELEVSCSEIFGY